MANDAVSLEHEVVPTIVDLRLQDFEALRSRKPDVTHHGPREEVLDIRTAFEIFDSDGSGIIDPLELKQSFIELGFTGGKFIYQILAELDEDQSGGIDFAEFLRLATAKIGEKDIRVDINKVFNAFDPTDQ